MAQSQLFQHTVVYVSIWVLRFSFENRLIQSVRLSWLRTTSLLQVGVLTGLLFYLHVSLYQVVACKSFYLVRTRRNWPWEVRQGGLHRLIWLVDNLLDPFKVTAQNSLARIDWRLRLFKLGQCALGKNFWALRLLFLTWFWFILLGLLYFFP